MQIHWTFDGCDEQDVARITTYWERVKSELAGKVAELSDAPSELRIAVAREDSDAAWELQAALHLPGNTLVAESQARTGEKALDQVLHGLALDIDRVDELPSQVTLRREGLDRIVALLEGCRAGRDRSQAFISFLSPLVASLGPYVTRELRVGEWHGTVVGEDLTTADVLDEVIVDAWDKFPHRNKNLSLDLWLVQLADEAIQRLGNNSQQQSLDDESPSPTVAREIEVDSLAEWEALDASDDVFELRELLPGEPSTDAWDELDLETKQSHLAQMLAKLPRDRRQAFVLNLVHGFNSAEIADFQNRSVHEVDADISVATTSIQRQFQAEQSPDVEEPFIRRELRQFRRKNH